MNEPKKIIGIAGRRGSGKDTAAGGLTNIGYQVAKFAGGIKVMLRAYLAYCGVAEQTIERMVEGDLKEVPNQHLQGRTPRYTMQTLGTDWGRNMMGEALWIDAFDAHIAPLPKVAVTDMRYPNEVQHIKSLGGTTVRLDNPEHVERDGDAHSSEALVDTLKTDYLVCNDKRTMPVTALHATMQNIAAHGWSPTRYPTITWAEVRALLARETPAEVA